MKKYKISIKASNDIISIYQYGLRMHGEHRAVEYRQHLLQRLDDIAETPFLYPLDGQAGAGYRRSVYGVNTIYYRINDGMVEIVRIIGRQDFTPRRG